MSEKNCTTCGDNWFEKDSREVTCEECFIQRQIARNNGERPNAKRVFGFPGIADGSFLMDACDYRFNTDLAPKLLQAGVFETCGAVGSININMSDLADYDPSRDDLESAITRWFHGAVASYLV